MTIAMDAPMSSSEEVLEVQERLVRVETKLDGLTDMLRARHSDDDARYRLAEERQRLHEDRTRLLETAMAEVKVRVALVAGGISFVTGVASAIIVRLVGG